VPALATATAAVGAAAMSFAGVSLDDHTGDRSEYVGVDGTVAPVYRTGMGSFDLYLADYPSDASTEIDVAAGDLTVVVPDNAHVQIDARIGVGTIDAFGSTRNGYRRTLSLDSNTSGERMISLKLRVGVGRIDVRRASLFVGGGPVLSLPPITAVLPDVPASQYFGDGTVLYDDGSISFVDGGRIEANGTYQITIVAQLDDGSVQLDNGAVIKPDGTVTTPGGFVIPKRTGISLSPSTLPVAITPQVSTTIGPEVQP
jgi:hypothetical protein